MRFGTGVGASSHAGGPPRYGTRPRGLVCYSACRIRRSQPPLLRSEPSMPHRSLGIGELSGSCPYRAKKKPALCKKRQDGVFGYREDLNPHPL